MESTNGKLKRFEQSRLVPFGSGYAAFEQQHYWYAISNKTPCSNLFYL
jgi:hypothetical protein